MCVECVCGVCALAHLPLQTCLKKEPTERPVALELLAHPFIAANIVRDTRKVLQDMYNGHIKLKEEHALAAAKQVRFVAVQASDVHCPDLELCMRVFCVLSSFRDPLCV